MASKTTAWAAGAGLAALVIAAGAWFGVISPTLTDAADQREAAADQRDHNDQLKEQIDRLKADFANLDQYKSDLAALRVKLPATGDLAELTRQIQAMGIATGVTVVAVAPGTPTAFAAPAAPAQPTPTPSESASTEPGDEPSASPDATPDDSSPADSTASGPTTVDGLFTVPLSVTVVGTYDQTVQFLDALQQQMPRVFVINELQANRLEASGTSSGRPAVNLGDLETTVGGYVLTLKGDDGQTAEPDPATTPDPLPVPGDQKNPFYPVG